MTPMRTAITGATGFIGRHVLRALSAEPAMELTALGRSPPVGAACLWKAWHFETAAAETAQLLRGLDTVCHIAAYIPANLQDLSQAEACWRANAWTTNTLIQAAKSAGVRHFVYLSGANILSADAGEAVTERAAIGCEHAPAYLGSKVMGEIFANAGRCDQMAVSVLRPTSVYGPGMPAQSSVARFLNQLGRGEPVTIRNPLYRADLVKVDDVAAAIVESIRRRHDGTLNIGSGSAHGLVELATIICQITGQAESLIRVEVTEGEPLSPGFPPVDISRARQEIAYLPQSLRQGIESWIESHGQGQA